MSRKFRRWQWLKAKEIMWEHNWGWLRRVTFNVNHACGIGGQSLYRSLKSDNMLYFEFKRNKSKLSK